MKKNILLFGLIGILISTLTMNSCAPDYETEFEVKTLVVPDKSLTPIAFPIEGGVAEAKVETNVELSDWSASSNADWLTVEKKEGVVGISAASNPTYAPRIARITIEYGYQAYYINVSQKGNNPILLVEGQRTGVVKSIGSVATTISVQVESNMVIDNFLVPDTANFVHFESIADVDGNADMKTVSFKVDQNMSRNARYSTITFQSSDNYAYTASFVVAQAGIVFEEIPLRADMLSSNAQEVNEGPIANLLDDNYSTFFHSAWSYSISEAHYIQVTLDEPIPGCAFWYQNRNNGNGKPQDVSIMVSADGSTWSEMVHITSGLPTGASSTYESAYFISETPFKYFRFVVNKTNGGTAPTYFNMAEFRMYRIQE
ncbi:BACON domain-containing carbohydrate-binding protein [Maribellus sp. YY47]|uniref:BACON domain-containing protein n=1 Tax=Maribellus sp. YY47 TaxID=2929486 RepID=UPI0020015124|nr:BACON domain-containing carbohydrate-binding protein [Maribellus sp. YY47]MCK3686428.1 discoidin domain-containing protein [Maribellus sp. YY47]